MNRRLRLGARRIFRGALDSMREDLAVLLAIVTRLDSSIAGLVAEPRVGRSQQARMDARLRAVEARQDATDPPH